MRVITLSNYADTKLAAAAEVRYSEYDRALVAHQGILQARTDRRAGIRSDVADAWNRKAFFSTLWHVGRYGFSFLSFAPSAPVRRSAGQDEHIWNSGKQGEEKVKDHIASQLADDWVHISGYRNNKGEIDQVLVGPRGVFCVEVKNVNGVVHCSGDTWWRDKYDRYGNMVESGISMRDKGGRSPSKQINETADALQNFLAKRTGIERVGRAVVLAHDSSRYGDMNGITVDVVARVGDFNLELFFRSAPTRLDRPTIDRVVKAIKQDHEFYNKPKQRRSPGQPNQRVKKAA